jgi:hypothetical protein
MGPIPRCAVCSAHLPLQDIVGAILDGWQAEELRLAEMLGDGRQVGRSSKASRFSSRPGCSHRDAGVISLSAEPDTQAGSTVESQQVEWKRPAARCSSASSLKAHRYFGLQDVRRNALALEEL